MIVHVFLTWQGENRKEEGKQKYVISLLKKGGLQEKDLHLFS